MAIPGTFPEGECLMGIFYEYIDVFNRAPVDLSVRFDGQDINVPVGLSKLPKLIVNGFAKNQHPIMGRTDPNNPHLSGGEYLIGIVGIDECTPLTKAEWEEHLSRPCRDDERAIFAERYANDPKARQVVYGKGRKTTASNRYEAGGNPGGIAAFEAEK